MSVIMSISELFKTWKCPKATLSIRKTGFGLKILRTWDFLFLFCFVLLCYILFCFVLFISTSNLITIGSLHPLQRMYLPVPREWVGTLFEHLRAQSNNTDANVTISNFAALN